MAKPLFRDIFRQRLAKIFPGKEIPESQLRQLDWQSRRDPFHPKHARYLTEVMRDAGLATNPREAMRRLLDISQKTRLADAMAFHQALSNRIQKLIPGVTIPAKEVTSLCIGAIQRGIPYRTVNSVIKKLHRTGRMTSRTSVRTVLRNLAGDLNMISVLNRAPVQVLPQGVNKMFKPKTKDILGLVTLLHTIGIENKDVQRLAENHPVWMKHAMQARRLLASPRDFIEDPEVQRLLRLSFKEQYDDEYARQPGNQKFVAWVQRRGLKVHTWLYDPFERSFNPETNETARREAEAEQHLHQTCYDLMQRLLDAKTSVPGQGTKPFLNARDRNRILSIFSRYKQLTPEEKPGEFIKEGRTWLVQDKRELARTKGRKFKIQQGNMSAMLYETIQHIQAIMERKRARREDIDYKLLMLVNDMNSLQRVVARYDRQVALTTHARSIKESGQKTYKIKKSDKNPIHFFTGGNDTGVCDATTQPQRGVLKNTVKNQGIQHHEIFVEWPQKSNGVSATRERRIGQIRLYLGTDEKDRPVLMVNSIDLEAEERKNTWLYRKAIEYVREYAEKLGVERLFLGRHGDMHISPFTETDDIKTLGLKHVREYVKIAHFFPKNHAFSDMFAEGYQHTEGVTDMYEVPLSKKPRQLRLFD